MLKGTNSVAGIFASSPITQPSEFTAGKEFLAKYKTAYNSEPAYAGHYTYDATFALAAAISKAESAIQVGISGSV